MGEYSTFSVRANIKRDSYTAHPIAEENISRERRREGPSKKPCMPRSLNTSHIRNETKPKREVLTFYTSRISGSGHGIYPHGELASLSTEGVSARFPFNKIKGEEP